MFVQIFDLLFTHISPGQGSWQKWKFYLYKSCCTRRGQESPHFKQSGTDLSVLSSVCEDKICILDRFCGLGREPTLMARCPPCCILMVLNNCLNPGWISSAVYKSANVRYFSHSNYPLPNYLITKCLSSCLLPQMHQTNCVPEPHHPLCRGPVTELRGDEVKERFIRWTKSHHTVQRPALGFIQN